MNGFSYSPSTVVGDNVSIASGSYWWFVKTAIAPVTFNLKKAGSQVSGYPKTDNTPVFDLNGNSNVFFQRGAVYLLTVTNASGTRDVVITVQ